MKPSIRIIAISSWDKTTYQICEFTDGGHNHEFMKANLNESMLL
jgi:hypothetical protein